MLTIRFDGTYFSGWQVQPNGITVQQRLQDALEAFLGTRPDVTGCSRTDAGVHANQFCLHFDTDSNMSPLAIINAVNAHLPESIAAYDCKEVPLDFHARYSCKAKNYIYKIYNSKFRNPFYKNYALLYRRPLDVELLNCCCKKFLGTHDFAGFCSSNSSVIDTVRTINNFGVFKKDDLIIVSITADGFLYNMVRILVGTLLYINEGKIDHDSIPELINSKDRKKAGPTVPPCGLYLNRVYY